jgi:predicted DNA-binding transcriptional regulator YafY
MPTSPNHRAKLLYLMKTLLEKTDEEHPMSINELTAELTTYGISAERKTLYADIETLILFGLDVIKQRGKNAKYHVASRQFELPELKLLVDAVQSSRFITEKKSEELISKLSTLTSENQAKELRRQIHVSRRAKSFNEQAYYCVDAIHSAIIDGKKISFNYFDYDVHKNRVYRKDGALYAVTPVTLLWDCDKYYLVAYSTEHNELRHYRVDRMEDTRELENTADVPDKNEFDVSKHVKRVFGMYSGEPVKATLSFDAGLINNILDQFGKDVRLTAKDNGCVEVTADVSVSPVFLSWIFQFGGRAEIKAPNSLIDAMRELIEANAKQYRPTSLW